MLDDGKVTFCDLVDISGGGDMPRPVLREVYPCMFENRIVGFNRRYAALGVNQDISALIRIWRPPLRDDRTPSVQVGMYAVLEESEIDGQYRVDVVQPLSNFDGINVLEITLAALEDHYDVEHPEDIDPPPFEIDEAIWTNEKDITTVSRDPVLGVEKSRVITFPPQTMEHVETFDVPASWKVTRIEVYAPISRQYFDCSWEWDVSDLEHPGVNGENIAYKRYQDNRGYAAGERTIRISWK